jgi:hypothetical protein
VTDVSNGDLTLEKEVFQIFLARLEKLIFRILRLEKLDF